MKRAIKNFLKKIKPINAVWRSLYGKYHARMEAGKIESYRRYGLEVLKDISQIIDDNHYACTCIEGTLLGLVRDRSLIPWDDDLDFVIIKSEDFSWTSFEKVMKRAGFWKFREIREDEIIKTESYKKKGVLCDFTMWENSDEDIVIQYGCYQFPNEKYINGEIAKYQVWDLKTPAVHGIHKEVISGVNVFIPNNSTEILQAIYGKDWRIPNAHYKVEHNEYGKAYRITYFRKPLFKN